MVKNRTIPPDLDFESLEKAARCLRTLAHPIRLRMVDLLLRGEHTVGGLADACGIPAPLASTHLGGMRDRGLLRRERRGREIYYLVEEQALEEILRCVRRRFGETEQ